ncbi:hypothetical protein ACWERV_32495 [Streptomyces sp. NPDC004031]
MAERARAGKDPQPWWLPRRLLTVVSADVDDAAGVAAIWILSRPGSSRMREHTELLERLDERWRHAGGGSGSGEDPVEVDVLDVCNGAGVLSLTRGLDPPRSLAAAPWIGCVKIHLGRDVRQVLVGTRLKEVPEQRSLVAVWTAPRSSRGERPVVVALGQDGAELSRMGARDALDTHTWARLREEL